MKTPQQLKFKTNTNIFVNFKYRNKYYRFLSKIS